MYSEGRKLAMWSGIARSKYCLNVGSEDIVRRGGDWNVWRGRNSQVARKWSASAQATRHRAECINPGEYVLPIVLVL